MLMKLDDLISGVLDSRVGRSVAAKAGFPEATVLRRGEAFPTGAIALGTVEPASGSLVPDALAALGVTAQPALVDTPDARSTDAEGRQRPPAYPGRLGAIVVDATAASRIGQLEQVRAMLRPAVKALEPSGRVLIVAADPATASEVETAAVRQALDGIMRSVGKELRYGATCNLIQIADGSTASELAQVLRFALSGRSAYVDGQPFVLSPLPPGLDQLDQREGRIVVVTGAARGIGAAIARRFGAEGARVVVVDVPVAGQPLAGVANEVHGTALQLDITVPDAGDRIARHVTERYGTDAHIDAVVHCAGILRDKLLANLDEQRWAAVLEVNLAAQFRINDVLLDPDRPGGLADGGRIVAIASTSGWAGNRGQTNYAASKAGVMGMVRALSAQLVDRRIAVNGVAPGFIETDMTASIPVIDREIFRRSSSLLQGGRPVDVAEAIVFLADPATPMNGQVLRVCGQLVVGR
ncbi:3-oxoacyl-ACP reductase [Micropruina sp.]|uniref:3-oxoacyl-ACP reductase n=1 Tax=Micropruina sp. TaxID=2737536 RepID=UPI0026182186|nr:3-oxoacyl-ACP reductase [Micropruina sp.]